MLPLVVTPVRRSHRTVGASYRSSTSQEVGVARRRSDHHPDRVRETVQGPSGTQTPRSAAPATAAGRAARSTRDRWSLAQPDVVSSAWVSTTPSAARASFVHLISASPDLGRHRWYLCRCYRGSARLRSRLARRCPIRCVVVLSLVGARHSCWLPWWSGHRPAAKRACRLLHVGESDRRADVCWQPLRPCAGRPPHGASLRRPGSTGRVDPRPAEVIPVQCSWGSLGEPLGGRAQQPTTTRVVIDASKVM